MTEYQQGFKQKRTVAMRTLVTIISITAMLSITGCSDTYEKCMKEEKRKNAYLGEADYYQQSSNKCAKVARAAK
jgi:hypothetical protein